MEKELLTTSELAKKLKVTKQTIYNWKEEGMPSVKVGSQYRYYLEDVLKWTEERK